MNITGFKQWLEKYHPSHYNVKMIRNKLSEVEVTGITLGEGVITFDAGTTYIDDMTLAYLAQEKVEGKCGKLIFIEDK